MKTKPVLCFFVSLVLFFSLFTIVQCSLIGAEVKTEPLPLDMKSLEQALDQVVDIGLGRNFLTLMVELPQHLPDDYKLLALALDRDKVPIRKVTGYTFDPEIKGKNQIWFYFVLFIPGGPRHELRPVASMPGINVTNYPMDYVQFILLKGNEAVMKKDVRRYDEFGNERSPLFVDMPTPHPEINGYLELKDYTFYAKNDYRKPDGYFIEGQIIGGGGTWNFFVPKSDIQGQEPEPQVKLPSAQGWLELRTGRTHQAMEAIAPQKPYVTGWWDGKGYFHPQPVKVQ